MKSGRLIRNGRLVDEPYCRIAYSETPDDFPPAAQASPSDVFRVLQRESYGNSLVEGRAFVVPADTYFVLNDNRNAIYDSRLIGPVKRESVIGRAILAYGADGRSWRLPRLVQ